MSSSTAELEVAIAPALEAVGAELVDLELRSNLLQVTVERSDGLDLETLAEMTRVISGLLDEREDLAPSGRYELEVSSPGLERRLRRPEHFQRALGRLVALRTVPGTPGDRRIEGELIAADEAFLELRLSDEAVLRLGYDQIERAHTVFDWKAALAEAKRAKDDREKDVGEDPLDPAAHAREKAIAPKREQRS